MLQRELLINSGNKNIVSLLLVLQCSIKNRTKSVKLSFQFGIHYYIDIIVVVGKRRISINIEIEFRVVPIAICEYLLQQDHSETIPKWMVPSEQISSIFVAGLCVRFRC